MGAQWQGAFLSERGFSIAGVGARNLLMQKRLIGGGCAPDASVM